MPIRPLPNDPSLEHLRKQAKRLRRAIAAGDAAAAAEVRELHPRAARVLPRFALSDAQLVVARGYGFDTWAKLKTHLAGIARFAWNTPPMPDPSSPVDVFLRLACLVYGDWDRSNPERAERMLREDPPLGRVDIYTAAAAGEVDETRRLIALDPAIVHAKGGPLGWEPLLYACYSRMPDRGPDGSTLEVARLLLAHGADPNAGFLWGSTYAFTALTGAFGEGEDNRNQLPHPHRDALATALLEAGADPNDSQLLYNRHFNENDDHLRLLFAYGLGRDRGGPWLARLNDRRLTPGQLLVEELWAAAKNNFPGRVELLLAHGVDVNARGLRDGRTPYEAAVRAGHRNLAEYLVKHGARRVELDPVEAFGVDILSGRFDDARARLAADPSLLEKLGHYGRVDLLHRAVDASRADAVRFVVGLGIDVNGMVRDTGLDRTALHNAAMGGNVEMVTLLRELGGDLTLRDQSHQATPIAWAAYGEQHDVVRLLMPAASIFDAVQCGGVERVAALLDADPSLATAADAGGTPLVFYLHPGVPRLAEMTALLLARGASLDARAPGGRTPLDRAIARGWSEFAAMLRARGAHTSGDRSEEA